MKAKGKDWLEQVKSKVAAFSAKYADEYAVPERQLSAFFEIGCFLSLVDYYERRGGTLNVAGLVESQYRYLTSPNGNPNKFSYVEGSFLSVGSFQIRQQVRIVSHLHSDIHFTPDIVVLRGGAQFSSDRRDDFAQGKRRFFSADASAVIAAHECKSMAPFPELMVSFVGMYLLAHKWTADKAAITGAPSEHLAPSMLIGGPARAIHRKLVAALAETYCVNIVTGLHGEEGLRRPNLRHIPASIFSTNIGA